MKKLLSITSILFGVMLAFAQVPEKMSYQAIVRNASGQLLQNQNVAVRASILQGSASGTVVYSERLTGTTNANGLLSAEIGTGTVISGTFSGINWSSGNYYLKTETDPAGGTNYTIAGTSQLLSVPYAMYAKTSGSDSSLTLPYAGTSSANNIVPFRITNSSGTLNQAGYFENTSASNSAPALMGINYSTGSFGTGVEGRAQSNTNGNMSMGVSGYISGTGDAGAGIYGSAQNATGVYGITSNGNGVKGYAYGTGTAGVFQSENTGKALLTIGPLQFYGNGAAAGKVLTASDASGNATWQDLPTTSPVWTTSGNNIYNTNTENVGIGINNPYYRLTVKAKQTGFSDDGYGIMQESPNGSVKFGIMTTNYGAAVTTFSDHNLSFMTNASGTGGSGDAMTLQKGTGNLGIGTTTPTEKLEVNGKTKTTNLQITNGAAAGKVLTSDASGNATWQDVITPNVHFSSLGGSSQAISQNTATIINSWTSNDEAGGANYNSTTGEYTIPITGYYSVTAQVSWSEANTVNAVSPANVTIVVNSISAKTGFSNSSVSGVYYSDASVKLEKTFAAGDKIKIQVYQAGRPTNNLYGPGTNFAIHLIHK